ncbi:Peptidase A4 family-domain-containing protein [Madurella fahalii]|uniref:Peptidase A4 family-domain-containing protein n=1 Tax=Madurella fahalii TaxID=1157608 RepID=A0ABQ0GES3_9PEZI
MRWIHAALLGSALLARSALAELTFTVEATRNGVAIPKSEIKLVPFEFGRSRPSRGGGSPPPGHQRTKTRRSNALVDSANWCGSVNYTPSTKQIKNIHGYFQHPQCSKRAGVTTYPQGVAAWVGIDGETYTNALLQSGTLCKIDNSTGISKNEAWWQWVPEAAFMIASMPVEAYDWFEVTINTTSNTAGMVTITNLSKMHTYTISVVDGPTLARVDADWVVERPYYGGSLAGFPSFSDVWFEDASATRTDGSNLGVLGASQFQIPDLCASGEVNNTHLVSWSL